MAENAVNTEQGVILEALNYKADLDGNNLTGTGFEDYIKSLGAGGDGYIVEEYHGENDWYYIYKDGKCLQGGKYYGTHTFTETGDFTVPFLLPLDAVLYATSYFDEYYKKYGAIGYVDGKTYYTEITNTDAFKYGPNISTDGMYVGFVKNYAEDKLSFTNITYYVEGILRR